MREIYIYLDLSMPCKLWDESSRNNLEDYIDDLLSRTQITSEVYENTTFKVSEIHCDSNATIIATVQVSGVYGSFREGSNEFEEETFIADYTPLVKSYIDNTLVPQINAVFQSDGMLSALPNAYIVFQDDRIFVELGYGQTAIDLDCYPVEVEFTEDIEDLVSDLYYTQDR